MQADFQSRADEQVAAKDAKLAELQRAVTELQEEKCALQAEREKLREDLQSLQQGTPVERVLENEQCDVNSAELERLDLRSEVKQVDTLSNRLKMAEEELALEKLQHQKRLDAVSMERDKAIRDLSRLKQHLLDKELADSEKMDHDSEQIQELEARAATSSARVLQLEQSLSLALANQAESNKRSADELRRAREEVESLNQKLSNVLLALDSKDVELANLQSALGQYYAESEAQERLHGELRSSKEEIARLLDNLRAANRLNEDMRQEKKDVLEKLALAEQKLLVNHQRTQKLEEDVSRLRHALEQSLTRLNRMSSDSDYYVDRRIVIKLLVTYFQRKHSHEVLDLMARMLGFSEEDKQRVGLAHDNAGKTGVVRSVLGIPGRFVGGLLGSGVPNTSFVAAENQSFADLWIDFLLKESEERDRRERAELDTKPVSETSGLGHDSMSVQANSNYHDEIFSGRKNIPQLNFHSSVNQKPSDQFPTAPPSPQDGYQNYIATTSTSLQGAENGVVSKNERGDIMGAEFSTVPLTSSSLPSRANFGHGKFASRS
ncbi:hypothetical protein O6H91_17G060200 [Diphasiastrum complanatum]|uniref:Uncharacterized protein n=1 Tax=Diphasiastrum complanatum TaxID=34168 RepID=A0ACC2B7G1_DIPCM|nr:hypothetical protein O6H91_17G060200 [Diphasiastrum complanatum]